MIDKRAAIAAIISMLKTLATIIGLFVGAMAVVLAGAYIMVRFELAGVIAVIGVGLVALFISEYRFEKKYPR